MKAVVARITIMAVVGGLLVANGSPAWARGGHDDGGSGDGGGGGGIGVKLPATQNLATFVADEAAAIRLGKAFFWEEQTGGDGQQACASCHFQAGADVRDNNTLNPGANGVFDTLPPGSTLTAGHFPLANGDVVGSQGLTKMQFNGLSGGAVDDCSSLADPVFGSNRQVTGRNTPFNINAIFNFRSFWDGRANNTFNGVSPFGPLDAANPQVLHVVSGVPTFVTIRLKNASLASQAVGPPNNGVEMSCAGRTFPQLGRKLLGLTPLGQQNVSPSDSVLGSLSNDPGSGLNTSYAAMIQAAFKPEWWDSSTPVGGFSVMENNFSLYWGLSVMLYESKLVADGTRFDRFQHGNKTALDAREQAGLKVFKGKGKCVSCHSLPLLTIATKSQNAGFINSGLRPVAEDGGDVLQPGLGFFKTPGLRNVELTGPYFHNGQAATLRQVVDFYDRGGDFRTKKTPSSIRRLNLSVTDKDALVAFMLALTDDRVKNQSAPFDHPSLDVPNGPSLPAVGATGGTPFQPFLNVDHFLP